MHKHLKFTYFYFLLLIYSFAVSPTFSQVPNLKFKHINTEHGLSNSTIETIYQDSRGFMWFGTRDGLNRYDGNSMVIFKHDLKNSTSISDNYITCVYEDPKKICGLAQLTVLINLTKLLILLSIIETMQNKIKA